MRIEYEREICCPAARHVLYRTPRQQATSIMEYKSAYLRTRVAMGQPVLSVNQSQRATDGLQVSYIIVLMAPSPPSPHGHMPGMYVLCIPICRFNTQT